ncbi:LOW QUALITY PROTEIN: uncharacterized protein ACWYII_004793, partial [Salvelinus alpinus]
MPKKDNKKDKKGGKPEPEKQKEEVKTGKDERKKGGKEDKKGGKKGKEEPPPKGKGQKEDKKGKGKPKKEESEEELLSEEEEEEEEDEEENSEDDRGRGRGGKSAKGKSHGRRGDEDEEYEEEDDEEDEDEDEDDRKRKKKSKDGRRHKDKGGKGEEKNKKKEKRKKEVSPEPPVKELPKKGLKNLSKMFMRFSGVRRRRNSRKKMGGTSRLFMGLGKRLRKNRENKVKKKSRRESILKNTSKFMIRFNHSKKNKKLKEKEAKEKEENAGGKKLSYMLIRLGRGTEGQEKKVGFFNGLFRKKTATGAPDFKAQSHLLGQVAGATNWLTKRFISTKHRQSATGGSGWAGGGRRSGFGRQGGGGHSRQVSMRGQQAQQDRNHGYQNGGYQHDDDGDDVYEYTEEYDQQDMGGYDPRGVAGAGGFQRRSVKDHGGHGYGHTGYDDQEDPYGQQQVAGGQGGQGYYYDDTGEFYDVPSQDPGYYEDEPGLYDDEGSYYDDQQGLYDDEGFEYYDPYQQQQHQQSYYDDQVAMGGYYGQQPMGMYGEEGGAMEYYDPMGTGQEYDEYGNLYDEQMMMDPQQGHYDNGMQGQRGFYDDRMGVYEEMMMGGRGGGGLYQDYQLHYSEGGLPFPDFSYNAYNYQQPGTQMPYGYDPMGGEIPQQGTEMAFRVPRPQVRLFGKERLDVPPAPFPPPPLPGHRDDILSEIQYEEQDMSMMSPQQQLLARQQKMMSQQQQMMEQQQLLMSQLTTPQEQTMSPHGMLMSQQQPMDDMMMQQQQQMISPHDMMMSQQRPMMSPQQQMDDILMQQQQQMMSPHDMMISQQRPMMSPQQQMDDILMQQQLRMSQQHGMMSPQHMVMSPQQQMMSAQQQTMDDIMMQQQLHMMSQQQQMRSPHDMMMSPQQQMMSERMSPTPTAMLIKQHNAPNGMGGAMMGGPMGYPGTPVMTRSPRTSPHPRRAHPSPTPSCRSMMMSPQQQMMSQHPSPRGSPLPTRSLSPSPQPSMRGLPPPGQRPPSVLYRRMSPPSSPHPLSPHRRLQPQRPPSLSLSPRRPPSPPISPRASMIRRSPPSSPRGSIRRVMPPPSSPSPSRLGGGSPFGARKVLPGTPSPSSPRRASPPASPQVRTRPRDSIYHPPSSPLSMRTSPSPSRRSFSPAPRPTSPTLSRHSTRLLRQGETPLVRPRFGGRGPVPMGTVRPSPVGRRGRPMAPTQNVPPFRTSVRSNHSALTLSPRLSPGLTHHPSPQIGHRPPLGHRESGRYLPGRPVGRGRPLMKRQSIRGPGMPPPSPQPSLKRYPPPSPHLSHRPSSPHPSIRASPLLPRAPSPDPYSDPYAQDPYDHSEQFVPSSPMLQGALQNQTLRNASFTSPHLRPMSPYAQQVPQYNQPSSPMLQGALQNQQLRNASFTSPLQQPMSPYAQDMGGYEDPMMPSSPMLQGALQNQQLRNASFTSPLQQPMSPYAQDMGGYEDPMMPSSPMLQGALQNQQLRNASYASPLQRPVSSYGSMGRYDEPLPPSSPMLGNAIPNQALRGASFGSPALQRRGNPYGPVVTQYDYHAEPGPSPLLHNALQNPNMRNASFGTPMLQRRGGNPFGPVVPDYYGALQNPQMRQMVQSRDGLHPLLSPYGPLQPDPRFGNALQNHRVHGTNVTDPPNLAAALMNPALKTASYTLPDGTIIIDPRKPVSPSLGRALQNPALMNTSYTLPDGTIIIDPRKPVSPSLGRALQNPALMNTSYTLPDGTIRNPNAPISPNLSSALNNPHLKSASYTLPDGSIIIDPRKPRSPNLLAALSNPYLKTISYELPDGSIIIDPRKPTSPNLSSALLNPAMRNASYALEGTVITDPNAPISPNLSSALMNPHLKSASYTLPDGSIIIDPRKPRSPNLLAALQNPYLKSVSYELPDGSVIIDPRKPRGPDLSGALSRNQDLSNQKRYRLGDGTLVIPGQKPRLGVALMNQNMRKVDYRLGDSGALSARPTNPRLSEALQENRDLLSPNRYRLPERNVLMRKFGNPYLDEALQNTQHLRYASYRLPPGLQGQDNRYAVVPPYGPRSGHWAGNARSGQEGDDVWASERVLPHGTVQNLTKWSMYREVMDSEGITPAAPGKPEGTGEPDWNPDREGEPNSWYEKIYSIRCIPSVGHRVKPWAYGMEDMTQMEELNETTVLMNLKKRYDQELIYTYIGSILVSVNPYKMFNMGTDVVLQYEGHGMADNPPHLFSIASVSYTTMMDSKHNQCIIISGESGSGKTEATKMVLRYLTAIHHKRNITQQILEATPLLESFGNAKTVRNDNSSRFGKYVEIFLEEGVISGAITSQYLLEKSRIVFQGKSERNYHIFYEMLSGLEPHQKRSLYLQEAETYFYLNQGGDCVIEGKDDGSDFRRVQSAMDILCFSPEEQNAIYRLLSSVLHLGNVYFQPYQAEGQEVATVVSDQEIRVVAELLQISPEGLKKAITHKVTDIVREKIYTPLTVESAVDARDAVAKILYSLLFHWLTEKINGRVYPRNEALSISILDIYGFEDLLFNSFEQLCINYANETLQFYFNRIIFREEQEEYIREQISWQELPFSDNQAVINLIAAKPHGILRILDDQCGFPQATDHTFLQKCNYHHGNSDLYARPKMPLPEFTVKHYAGKVTYQVHKFLHKNFDLVRQDVLELFSGSKNRMVSNLFLKHSEGLAAQQRSAARRGSTARRLTGNTVSAKFQSSLQDLVEKMERCNPYFVRCIKPNQQKEPGQFDLELVKTQLRYSGILETIRIRKEGYPIRIPFYQFLNRYKALLCLKEVPPADGETCVEMIYKLCPVKPGTYQVGVTKMFLKEQLYQLLEWKRDLVFHVAAVTMQRYTRLYFIRKKRNKFRSTMIQLQSCCRGHLARKRFALKRKYLIKFRSIVLLYINRRSYMKAEIEPIRRAEEEFRRIEEERANREVVNVTTLPIPAELGFLLQATAGGRELHSECLALVQAPKVQVDPQLTLPLDINNYLITHYIRTIFREALFGMLFVPLDRSLTRVDEELNQPAVDVFMLILRFMGDPDLNGAQENLFGNYIIQKGLANRGLRDEILAQVANQVWRNVNPQNSERGWLLLSACLSSFPPSQRLEKYLLKFVSDYGSGGYDCLCQHRLLQAMQRTSVGYHGARTYPPCLLEWTANRKRAHTVLQIHCYNGVSFLCPLHSWTTGEVLARDVLQH